jgi:hypothetical protein
MRKTVDQLLWYRGEFDAESRCRVRVYKGDGLPVVIVTELLDNPGSPLSFGAEGLAERLWKKLRKPVEFVYIEHQPGGADVGVEFSDVQFNRDGAGYVNPGVSVFGEKPERYLTPGWGKMSREEVEAMIGGQIEE